MRRTFSAACLLCDTVCCLSSGQWHIHKPNQMHTTEMQFTQNDRKNLQNQSKIPSTLIAVVFQVPGNYFALKILFSSYISIYFIVFIYIFASTHTHTVSDVLCWPYTGASRALYIFINVYVLYVCVCVFVCVCSVMLALTFFYWENNMYGWGEEEAVVAYIIVV